MPHSFGGGRPLGGKPVNLFARIGVEGRRAVIYYFRDQSLNGGSEAPMDVVTPLPGAAQVSPPTGHDLQQPDRGA